jgi:hypothetical protein
MNAGRWARYVTAALAAVALVGCATAPPAPLAPEEEEPAVEASPPSPLVEYPPIEPVEPPLPEPPQAPPAPEPTPAPAPAPSPAPSPTATPPTVTLPPIEVSGETLEVMALLADLQRIGALSQDDARRELGAATQALSKQRTDANRVRLAVLYTIAKTSPQDDQRALQLLDNVARSNPGSPAVKQVAAVIHTQISERVRAVRDEQQKADAAIQKLEALRAMERSLLRDRVRSGGGGGAGGGGGGAGSGGGGGGGSGGSGGR